MEDISMNFNLVDFIDGDWSQELVSPTSLDPGCDKVILSNNDITDILALEEVDNLPQGRQGFKDTQDAISKSPAQAQNGASEAQLCPVCQRPTGTHAYYGVRVCVSCRGFFRRTVQNEHNVLFRCLQDQMCTIDSTSRRSCKYCRYKQCLQAGMKPQLVMSSADRKKRILQKYQNNEGPLNCDANLTHVRRAFGLTTIFTTEDELEVGQEFKVFLEFSHEAYINHFSEHLDVFGELIRCAYLGCIYPVHLMRSMDHLDEATTANYLFLWVEMRDLSPFDRMTLFQNNYPLIYGLLWGTFSKSMAFFYYFQDLMQFARERKSKNPKAQKLVAMGQGEHCVYKRLVPTQDQCLYMSYSQNTDGSHLSLVEEVERVNAIFQDSRTGRVDCVLVVLFFRTALLLTRFNAHLEQRSTIEKLQTHYNNKLLRYIQQRYPDKNICPEAVFSQMRSVYKIMQSAFFPERELKYLV